MKYLITLIFLLVTIRAFAQPINCSDPTNAVLPECGGSAAPAVTPKPAPPFYNDVIIDYFGKELPIIYPYSTAQLQIWHDDAASEGPTKAYAHYLACWHSRAIEQRECSAR